MYISVEISYYPLTEEFNNPISEFIGKLLANNKIQVESGKMSTVIYGEYPEVMNVITHSISDLMEKYPSVFNMKISNTCPVTNTTKNK